MSEKRWIYKVVVASPFSFRFLFSRKKQIEEICTKFGEEGWEASGITFNPFNMRYLVLFKKEVER